MGLSGGRDPSFEALARERGRGGGVSDEGGGCGGEEQWLDLGCVWKLELAGEGKVHEGRPQDFGHHVRGQGF